MKGRGPTKRKPTPRTIRGIPGTVEPGYREQPLVEHYINPKSREQLWRDTMRSGNPSDFQLRYFTMGACNILGGREPAGRNGELLWHLSISTPSRHPSWDEIKTARYRLLPRDLTFAILLPPAAVYVNVPEQNHVFHLYEVNDPRKPWTSM